MFALVTEDFDKQVGAAVDDLGVFFKVGDGVDHSEDFDDLFDPIEGTEFVLQDCQKDQADLSGIFVGLFGSHIGTNFAGGVSGTFAGKPERVNPGDSQRTLGNVVKLVAAQDTEAVEVIEHVYGLVVNAGTYRTPNIRTAEAAKVIENIQRDLNIALMNELAIIFNKMDINTHDVLKAANTKWNFLPFEPGLVGGHCIGIDPYYLTHKSSLLGYNPEVILAGRSINDSMGEYIGNAIIDELKRKDKDLNEVMITILGITFKENIPDIRNSKVMDIYMALLSQSVKVQIYDPHFKNSELKNEHNINLSEFSDLKKSDAIILAVPHKEFIKEGWRLITKLLKSNDGIVYDVKSVLSRNKKPEKINLMRL